MLLNLINENEINFDRHGKLTVRVHGGKLFLIGIAGFVSFFFLLLPVVLWFPINPFMWFFTSLLVGWGATPSAFYFGVRRELQQINSARGKPHKIVPNIVDWEKGDELELPHFSRIQYLGVTDDFKIILGKRKHITIPATDLLNERNFQDVWKVPPLYVKRYLEENTDYKDRNITTKKEKLLGAESTYEEYLDTISQEKDKLNGRNS